MPTEENRPVCQYQANRSSRVLGDYLEFNCPRCGSFSISNTLKVSLENGKLDRVERAKLSSWIRTTQPRDILNHYLLIDGEPSPLARQYQSARMPTVVEKADKLIMLLARESEFAGQRIDWRSERFRYEALVWAINQNELFYLFDYLSSADLIREFFQKHPSFGDRDGYVPDEGYLTPAGWQYVQNLQDPVGDSQQGFVAMWFDDAVSNAWHQALMPAIEQAGYLPLRLDMKQHNEKIDDEIIAEIRKSRFVIADFTGHRGGVYYEAGFAHGLGIPVIFTCRDDSFADLHFDIRQYNCIGWEKAKLDEFRHALAMRIEATLGRGDRSPMP